MLYWSALLQNSPIGPVALAASERGLVRISLYGAEGLNRDAHFVPELKHANRIFETSLPVPSFLSAGLCQVEEYLLGKRRVFDLPLDLEGFTPLARQILETCRAIPFGEVRTYR